MKTLMSPKEVARAVGVSESSVKRWVDEGMIQATRTAGGHRRIGLAEAVRFIRSMGLAVVSPGALGAPEVARALDRAAGDAARGDADELYAHLLAGNAELARGLLLARYLGGASVAELADGPIRGAMGQLGELWHHREDGVFLEHRAFEICQQALSTLRLAVDPGPAAPFAIGGAAPSDPYRLPTLLAGLTLLDRGFQAVNLGAHTPIEALRHGAHTHQARLVWLSVSLLEDKQAGALRREVEQLARELGERGACLVVGGRASGALGLRRSEHLFLPTNLSELAAFAAGLRQSTS